MSIIEKAIEKAKRRKSLEQNKSLSGNTQNIDIKAASQTKDEKRPVTIRGDSSHISKNISIIKNNQQGKFLFSEQGNSQMSEEYRVIKRPLIKNALGAQKDTIKRANLILVTSSQPGEGKTFTAINLALSIASERDKKVLLVDADVAKPSISHELGIDGDYHGLIDYLDGEELDFYMMMIKTDIPGLSIIPAGKKHGYSTELLASNRMALLAEELHSRYSDRIVIFDSPPLLAATQAEVLTGLVGQVVLVVEAEKTIQSMVSESLEKLKECDVVLTLLNKSNDALGTGYYGYGQYGH